MRLADGESRNEGRVEVCLGSWATICDPVWDDRDAAVVCQQMGFSLRGEIAICLVVESISNYHTYYSF